MEEIFTLDNLIHFVLGVILTIILLGAGCAWWGILIVTSFIGLMRENTQAVMSKKDDAWFPWKWTWHRKAEALSWPAGSIVVIVGVTIAKAIIGV